MPPEDWIAAGFHPVYGDSSGLRIYVGGRIYRLVAWVGARHHRDHRDQVWMHDDDYRRNLWVEVDP